MTKTPPDPHPGKYSRWECERRFTLAAVPVDFMSTAMIDIWDRYLTDTRLRVRRMTDRTTGDTTYKLGQKLSADPSDLARLEMTNMYISDSEFELLRSLPGHDLRKVRHRGTLAGTIVSIDEFPDQTFVIATVDFDDATSMRTWQPPDAFGEEVTNDRAYSGAYLAAHSCRFRLHQSPQQPATKPQCQGSHE